MYYPSSNVPCCCVLQPLMEPVVEGPRKTRNASVKLLDWDEHLSENEMEENEDLDDDDDDADWVQGLTPGIRNNRYPRVVKKVGDLFLLNA